MNISPRRQAETYLRLQKGYHDAWIKENDLGDWNAYRWEAGDVENIMVHLFHIKNAKTAGRSARCTAYSEKMYRFLEETLSYTDITLD